MPPSTKEVRDFLRLAEMRCRDVLAWLEMVRGSGESPPESTAEPLHGLTIIAAEARQLRKRLEAGS